MAQTLSTSIKPDYQIYTFTAEGGPVPEGRMQQKFTAVQGALPDFEGKEVLDIGCDFGFWTFLASALGAKRVVGLDRNRNVRGHGNVDLVKLNRAQAAEFELHDNVEFHKINLGKQYRTFGKFDFAYLMSLYHHIYQCTGGDHLPIWYWLHQQLNGYLLWENPVDVKDGVANRNIEEKYHLNYNKEAILYSAEKYFEPEYIGKALHEPYRYVYKFHPKPKEIEKYKGKHKDGAGGAYKAFLYKNKTRIKEIDDALGMTCVPGSFNVWVDRFFHWDKDYYRVQISDLKDRYNGLDSEWVKKWCRFYPVKVNGFDAYAMRFEKDRHYPEEMVEIISDVKLIDKIKGTVEIES